MAALAIDEFLRLQPAVQRSPDRSLWSTYDAEADVLYINFKKPCHADDSELTDDDVVIRYERGAIVGLTIMNAGKRNSPLAG
jgi:uncharacterized protein YuzE